MTSTAIAPNFATLVREFFCGRLIAQQNVSSTDSFDPQQRSIL